MGGQNPCDLCRMASCDGCVLDAYTHERVCGTADCMLYYEGACVLGLYERCGAWEHA